MLLLNLIHPEKSEIGYEKISFPDSQPHIRLQNFDPQPVKIITRIASPADLLYLLFAKNALDYAGVESVHVVITYLLAARMDRVMTDGEPFSLKVMGQLLNTAGFRSVKIFDPHSEVALAVIDRSSPITNASFAQTVLSDLEMRGELGENWTLVSPDAGALKKVYKVSEYLAGAPVVECLKIRDPKTGKLSGFKVIADDLSGKTCIILDDICDGGGTFSGIGQILKEKGAKKVILAVSHGIFSKGFTIPHVDIVYCTDSYREFVDLPPSLRVLSAV